ncbi:hypothetical protein [Nonomuraea sp. SYSU D8015]|nr:hypothetical protein [Nonomuraea sp. SYSU D8015]
MDKDPPPLPPPERRPPCSSTLRAQGRERGGPGADGSGGEFLPPRTG